MPKVPNVKDIQTFKVQKILKEAEALCETKRKFSSTLSQFDDRELQRQRCKNLQRHR
jgi:hypothetical protein